MKNYLDLKFEIPDALTFEEGPGGLIFTNITTPTATARICLHGAHLTSFIPKGQEEVLWLSPDAIYHPDKAIRGGIPICWPWFSAHPSDPIQPSHGYARLSQWKIAVTSMPDPNTVEIQLTLPGCSLKITVSDTLSLQLTTHNNTDAHITLTSALHTYLRISDISKIHVQGLDHTHYLDDVDGSKLKSQTSDVTIEQEVDRRYENTTSDILVHDQNRTLRVTKTGSHSTVVWNPWSNRAAEIADMPDNGYQTMLCIEAANAGSDIITLAPGASHTLGTEISIV
jgi:glucose-6-phosphate 1-epimerase